MFVTDLVTICKVLDVMSAETSCVAWIMSSSFDKNILSTKD